MVYHSERSIHDEWEISREESCYGVDLRQFYLLLELHIGKYTCHCLGEHGFTTSWWSLHQDIVSSSSCDEESPLRMLLPDDIREVRRIDSHLTRDRLWSDGSCWDGHISREDIDDIGEACDPDHIDIGDHGCLQGVIHGDEYPLHPELSREYGCWEGSLDRSHESIEGQFSEKERFSNDICPKINILAEYS